MKTMLLIGECRREKIAYVKSIRKLYVRRRVRGVVGPVKFIVLLYLLSVGISH